MRWYLVHLIPFLMMLSWQWAAYALDPILEREMLRVLLETLEDARISGKQAAIAMRYTPSQWSDICAGKLHTPSMTRLYNIGPHWFFRHYWPAVLSVMAKHHALSVATDSLHMAKASIVHADSKEKAAS